MRKKIFKLLLEIYIILSKGLFTLRKYSERNKIWHDRRCLKLVNKGSNKKRSPKINYNKFKPKTFTVVAPSILSLIKNREETEAFFSKIIDIYNKRLNKGYASNDCIYLNFENISEITTDSLIYLIAITTNLPPKVWYKLHIGYSLPHNNEARQVFFDSGFINYVHKKNPTSYKPTKPTIQIISGDKVNPRQVADIIEFIKLYCTYTEYTLRNIYTILIEIMTNKVQHAYKNTDYFVLPKWYLYIDVEDKVNITILDIGEGIPSTISRRLFKDMIYTFYSNTESLLLSSALDGELRTETKQPYRGKGLPHIVECYENKYIDSLYLISGKGSVYLNRNDNKRKLHDSDENLLGTLFHFKI
ncbi:MAG: hypothetical protein NC395_05320 [Prevotella sp.]|nr:hypothetical protein [Prevotella sp.]